MRRIPVFMRVVPVRRVALEIWTVGTAVILVAAWKLIPWTQ